MNARLELTAPLRDLRRAGTTGEAAPAAVTADAPDPEAYQRGYRDGQQSLQSQLDLQRAELHATESGVLAALRQAVPGVVRDTEQAVTTLALEVARKLVADLPLTPEIIAATVREAIAHVEDTTEFHIHLHAEDLELLRRVQSTLLQPAAPGIQFHFHAASDVSRGGCLVKTRFGVIDGRRETKFDLLKQIALG